jgi:hypothetical protein
MNRKERRIVEKKLKLTEFFAKQPLAKKLERIAENIENGKKKQIEFNNGVETWLQSQRDSKNSEIVESKAEYIAKTKSIPYIDALNEANGRG